MTKLIIDLITSKNPLLEDSDPCWDNYKQIGLKKKDGKTVPNCVPQEKTNMKAIKVSEKLSVSAGMGAWIKDFQDSDAPQFADADEDERRTMAIAAFLAAKRESKKSVEKEEEQVDELKTSTLLRYANKAGKDGLSKGIAAARASDMDDLEAAALLRQKRDKRYAGQNQALNKIRSKVTKEAKQVNEETISEAVRVHVNDGSDQNRVISLKSINFLKTGMTQYNGKYDGSSNKGAFFKFKKASDANEFISYIKNGEFSHFFTAEVTKEEVVAEGTFGQNRTQYPIGSTVSDKDGNKYKVLGYNGQSLLLKGTVDGNRVSLFPNQLQQKEEVEIKEDELSQKKKEEVVTVRHKDSGKELSIVKTAVADYQKRGYYPVKESTSKYAQSANKILDDLKKANISAADKAKLAQLADLMAKMKDK